MHPILFKIGPITLHTYGLFVALGFIIGVAVAMYLGKQEGIPKEKILDIGFYSLIAAIIGSRVLFVLIDYKYFLKNPLDILKLWEGGLVFMGGVVSAILVLVFYLKKNSLLVWKTLDLFAPSLAIGHAFGRIGCFSAGCCYGKPTDLPWGVTFNNPQSLAVLGIPLHPTQLYESFAEFGIFIFLIFWRRHKKFDGQVSATYILLYSIARFIIEFFRGDRARGLIYNNFSMTQGISVLLFFSSITFLIYHYRKQTRKLS